MILYAVIKTKTFLFILQLSSLNRPVFIFQVEIGNYDSFYEMGLIFSPEQVVRVLGGRYYLLRNLEWMGDFFHLCSYSFWQWYADSESDKGD